jgi:integrase
MEVAKPSFDIFLDKRRKKEGSNKYPVKLKVTFLRVRDYISLNYDLTEEEFEKMKGSHIRIEELKKRSIENLGFLQKARITASELDSFDFREFKRRFLETEFEKKQKERNTQDVYNAFAEYAELKIKNGDIKTGKSYDTALNSFKSFKAKLIFDDVTPEFLKAYERFMLSQDKSITTVGIYMRNLRTILNEAIGNGNFDKSKYPFGRGKYIIPASKNKKKALTKEDLRKMYQFETAQFSNEDKAKDFWFLSYFCNGINMKDICKLKNEDLSKDKLAFVREKTKNTNRANQAGIEILLTDLAKLIINKWRTTDNRKDAYLFDILKSGLEPKRESELIENFIKTVNKHVDRIAKSVGIEEKVTTYFARHSYATTLLRDGVSVEFISKELGHRNITTTQSYLGSFEDESRIIANQSLTSFLDGN